MPSKPIVYVSGDKGGVGKSIATLALLDYCLNRDEPVLLVETDTSNPDVWRCYGQEAGVLSELVTLDEADGWIALLNLCEAHPDRTVVVNTAARNNVGVARHGDLLNGGAGELDRALVALWIINRQRDSVELLKRFLPSLPAATVHVLRNLYFGDEGKFERYNQSALRRTVEERGGRSLNFPDLADRVADDLFSGRLSIARALRDLPLGNRAELRRWQKACAVVLDAVIGIDGADADEERADVREATA
jgi:hypothetical protein